MKPLLRFLTPQALVGAGVIIALGSVAYAITASAPKGDSGYVHPTQGPLTEEVDTSGTVKAADTIDLSFDAPGRIVSVHAPVGTQVSAGTVLASLSAEDASAALSQADAALAVQQAKLAGLEAGARPESIAVAQTAVTGAQNNLSAAKTTLAQAIQDTYVKGDDAIRNRVDQFVNNPRTSNPTLPFTLSDSSLQNAIIAGRISAETRFAAWKGLSDGMSDPAAATPQAVAQARAFVQQASDYLDTVAAGLTTVIPNTSYPSATIQGYQSSVATARTNLSASLAALNTAATAEAAAESALANANSQLTLTQAPAQQTDIDAQKAQVAVAQANVDAAQAQLDKTVIRAPITGTITRNDAHPGSIASPSQPLITIISSAKLQVEAYVSQADLAHLSVGQAAKVRLDAYPGDELSSHLALIDPSATIQNGVAAYRVVLQFDSADPRLKAGLSANVAVTADQSAQALMVPNSAIIRQGDATFVLAKSSGGDMLKPVTIGIVGKDQTQIVSGLTPQDLIRAFGNQ